MARKPLSETSPFRNGTIRNNELEQKRAQFRRTIRATVACPFCGAPVGQPCITVGHDTRVSNHRARLEAWEESTGRLVYPAWQARKRRAQRAKRSRGKQPLPGFGYGPW